MAEEHVNPDLQAASLERQIRETRAALASKVALLSDEVKGQLHDSLSQVTGRLSSGIDQVTESVTEGVHGMATAVETAVGSVRSSLDVREHIRRTPFKAFAVSVAAGFLVARAGQKQRPIATPPTPHKGISAPIALLGVAGGLLRPWLLSAANTYLASLVERHMHPGAAGERRTDLH